MGMEVAGDPNFPRDISCVQVLNERKQRFEGPEKVVLTDLMEFIKVHDPDVIPFPYANTWVPIIVKKAKRLGLQPTFSRSGFFKSMASKSYWSYGKVNHKDGVIIPEGWVLIDTARASLPRPCSRPFLWPPDSPASRQTSPLVSPLAPLYPLLRGLRGPEERRCRAIQGERDAEAIGNISEMRASDKGGIVFQPEPGVYEKPDPGSFSPLYPSIIVKYNLSPETIEHPDRTGFLASVLSSLLNLRI